MLSTIFELGKESAFATVEDSDDHRDIITENTKFIIGDKRNQLIWKKATSPLLESKK
jgi:hypothetical protein